MPILTRSSPALFPAHGGRDDLATSARLLSPLVLVLLVLAPGALIADDRSTELMHYECSSTLSRRDVTLFANGTVRLRQGPWEDQALYLDELLREELASYVKQLRDIQTSAGAFPVDMPVNAPSGDWIETCEMRLMLPETEPKTYAFTTYEIPPLMVANLIHVAEDLADFTKPLERSRRVPKDYSPRPGDMLQSVEGGKFRVVGLTGDALGVELEELGTPVMILMPLRDLRELFSILEAPGHP